MPPLFFLDKDTILKYIYYMEDNKLTWKSQMFLGGYYFAVIFLTACILHDILIAEVTGFTFGFAFAIFYFIARLRDAHQLVEDLKSDN